MCLSLGLGRERPAPALGLMGVKELLSIGEAACADLINSTRIKLLCHEGLRFALSEKARTERRGA